jgi:hypothetical protein
MSVVKGWVYVMTNESMPDLVKVGFSTKDPSLRAAELNHTGVPTPYQVIYEGLVHEPRAVEQRAHVLLKSHRVGKEWFRCDVQTAVAAIQSIAGNALILELPSQVDKQNAPSSLVSLRPLHPTPQPENTAGAAQPSRFATPEEKAAFVQEVLREVTRRELERRPLSSMPATPEAESFKKRSLAAYRSWASRQKP